MGAAVPLPSSTVILLREEHAGGEPFSVLMLERHGSITFPGAHAFPGGVLEAGDADCCGATLPVRQRWAEPGLGDGAAEALPYWIAAVRELFEELGILLARRDGHMIESSDAALRARVLGGEPFASVLADAGLVPATDELYYLARWITPVTNPRRFDTRFLVGRMPAGQEACVDGTETVSCGWFTPRAALAAYQGGRIVLIPPTVRTLDDLSRFSSIDAVLEDAARRIVRAVTPELVQAGSLTGISYPNHAGDAEVPPRRLVLRDGRWRPADD
jgi:8-oxo-dGTP pyrophosphatase MutT (NUDIX family)